MNLRPLGYKTNGIIAIFIVCINKLELLIFLKEPILYQTLTLYAISQSLQPEFCLKILLWLVWTQFKSNSDSEGGI